MFVQCLTREILIELLAAFGEGTEIRPPFYCDYGYQTSVGARCFLNWGVTSLDLPQTWSQWATRHGSSGRSKIDETISLQPGQDRFLAAALRVT